MPTKQETFDKVLFHLRVQGKQSRGPSNGACAYRGAGGVMCSAGVCIPDTVYRKEWEGTPLVQLTEPFPIAPAAGGPGPWLLRHGYSLPLLDQLQEVHDSWCDGNTGTLERQMRLVAQDFGLVYTPPGTIPATLMASSASAVKPAAEEAVA